MLKSWGSCSPGSTAVCQAALVSVLESPQLCSEGFQQLEPFARNLEAQVLGLLAFSVPVVCSVCTKISKFSCASLILAVKWGIVGIS